MAANLFFVCRSYRKLLLVPMLQERPGRWRMVQQFQKPLSQEKRLLQQLGGWVLLQEWMIFHYWFKTVGTLVDSRIPEKQTQTVLQNGCSHCNSSVRLYIRDPLNFCSPPELPRSNGLLNFIRCLAASILISMLQNTLKMLKHASNFPLDKSLHAWTLEFLVLTFEQNLVYNLTNDTQGW